MVIRSPVSPLSLSLQKSIDRRKNWIYEKEIKDKNNEFSIKFCHFYDPKAV
jgi:hypothetical protein